MERLTVKAPDGHWQIRDFTELLPAYWQACNRLAAYEDTGLEPDLINAAINGQITIQKALSKYTQAEDEGRLVVLEKGEGHG